MNERDPDIEAKWRAASREEPPAALDDAIRAAARREVGARPGRFRAAPRWVPLAAAATIAAVAVGIVQMTPPDQVTPSIPPPLAASAQRDADAARNAATTSPSASTGNSLSVSPSASVASSAGGSVANPVTKPVTDSVSSSVARSAANPSADKAIDASEPSRGSRAATTQTAPTPQPQVDAPKRLEKEQEHIGESDRGDSVRNRAGAFATAPAGSFQEKKTLALDQAVLQRQASPERAEDAKREQALKQKNELASAFPKLRAPSAGSSSPPAGALRSEAPAQRQTELRAEQREPPTEMRAFPAAPPIDSRTVGAAPPRVAAAPGPRVAPPMAAAPAVAATPASVPAPAASPAPSAAAPPVPAPPIPTRKLAEESQVAGKLSAGGIGAKDAAGSEPAAPQNAAVPAKADAVDAPTSDRRKDARPLSPDEWIRRIRRLIAEGRNDDAAKELVAFRREYKERSEALLPADLRAFKP